MKKFFLLLFVFTAAAPGSLAQIGSHRSDFSLGVNGGYVLGNIGFTPKVTQQMHKGFTGGLSFRYVCEKYFSTVCSIYAECNYTCLGWSERLLMVDENPVINSVTGIAETYSRDINYLQIPIFAHLAWGRETKGFQFFFQAGPQFGIMLSEKTRCNYALASRNLADRANQTCEQESMPVENKFDYGIAAGLGIEYSAGSIGHFLLEGRYYYGLGNIYGDSKKDWFAKSNINSIVVKLSWLFDIARTKNP
jgi:hypothetical protein